MRSRLVADPRRPRRARRGRPAKMAPPATASGYRLVVAVEALPHAEEDKGWTVRSPTVRAAVGSDPDILQA